MKTRDLKTNEAVANYCGAMEADTISKNGAITKSLMRVATLLIFFLFLSGILVNAQNFLAITYEDGTREGISVVTPTRAEQPATSVAASQNEMCKFYVGFVGGYGILGPVIGIKGAYFFNQKIGVGLSLRRNTWTDWYEWDSNSSVNATFFGPVFYGHWGKRNSIVYFPTAAGVGISTYKETSKNSNQYETTTIPAIYLSQGIAVRPVDLFSIGANLEIGGGSLFGFSVGINFHF